MLPPWVMQPCLGCLRAWICPLILWACDCKQHCQRAKARTALASDLHAKQETLSTAAQARRHGQKKRCVQVRGMCSVKRGYLPMSNVVTQSALTCEYFIKIIYNPFSQDTSFTQATDGMTASRGAVKRCRGVNVDGFFSDRKPRGKWRQQRVGKRGARGEIGLAGDPMRIEVAKKKNKNKK